METILEKLISIENRLTEIETKLENKFTKIETKLFSHIDFIENVYTGLKMPLNYINSYFKIKEIK
jgi:hypothetical protein